MTNAGEGNIPEIDRVAEQRAMWNWNMKTIDTDFELLLGIRHLGETVRAVTCHTSPVHGTPDASSGGTTASVVPLRGFNLLKRKTANI
jgi:hypothetical protein